MVPEHIFMDVSLYSASYRITMALRWYNMSASDSSLRRTSLGTFKMTKFYHTSSERRSDSRTRMTNQEHTHSGHP